MKNMLTCIKRNKTFKKRKLYIYDDDKFICYVEPWMGWVAYSSKTNHSECRKLVMQNLYWLLGHDCDFDEWKNSIDAWNEGKHIYGVPIDKLSSRFFSEEEMNVALNSFYN